MLHERISSQQTPFEVGSTHLRKVQNRLAEALSTPETIKARTPALALVRSKAGLPEGSEDEEPRRWNAMAELGAVPPWGMLSKEARETCEACELRSMASHAVCSRCQLVDVLWRLMEVAR